MHQPPQPKGQGQCSAAPLSRTLIIDQIGHDLAPLHLGGHLVPAPGGVEAAVRRHRCRPGPNDLAACLPSKASLVRGTYRRGSPPHQPASHARPRPTSRTGQSRPVRSSGSTFSGKHPTSAVRHPVRAMFKIAAARPLGTGPGAFQASGGPAHERPAFPQAVLCRLSDLGRLRDLRPVAPDRILARGHEFLVAPPTLLHLIGAWRLMRHGGSRFRPILVGCPDSYLFTPARAPAAPAPVAAASHLEEQHAPRRAQL